MPSPSTTYIVGRAASHIYAMNLIKYLEGAFKLQFTIVQTSISPALWIFPVWGTVLSSPSSIPISPRSIGACCWDGLRLSVQFLPNKKGFFISPDSRTALVWEEQQMRRSNFLCFQTGGGGVTAVSWDTTYSSIDVLT